MTNDNRRKHTRVAVDLTGTLVAEDTEHPCQVHNLSLGGALVATRLVAPVGSSVEFSVTLGDNKQSVSTTATVRWTSTSQDGDAQLGLQFAPMGARATYMITEYLAKIELG